MPAWFPRSIFGTVLVVVYVIEAGIGGRAGEAGVVIGQLPVTP